MILSTSLEDYASKVFHYKNGVQRNFKNKRVLLMQPKGKDTFLIKITQLCDKDKNHKGCNHVKLENGININAIHLTEETLKAIILNYLTYLEDKKQKNEI